MTDMTIDEELAITCEQRDALDIECARLEKEVDALRKDAERYRKLRRMCCSADGPTEAIAAAWMIGDEQAADVALDAAGS